jgi:hypothetical protein
MKQRRAEKQSFNLYRTLDIITALYNLLSCMSFFVLNYAVCISDRISSNCMMIEWWIGKDLQGSGHSIIKVLSRNFLEGRRKVTKALNEDGLCSDQDSNGSPSEYESRASLYYNDLGESYYSNISHSINIFTWKVSFMEIFSIRYVDKEWFRHMDSNEVIILRRQHFCLNW